MENSYRFLMMAATLIVGILLLSMLVYVFRAGARASKAVDEAQMEQQLIAENAKFEHYNRVENTTADMISLINLVYNYNKTRDFAPSDCVNVVIYLGQSSKCFYIGEDTSVLGITRKSSELKRNEVWYSEKTEPQSVNNISEMIGYSNSSTDFDKLVRNESGDMMPNGRVSGNNDDKLSLTRYDAVTGKTIHKYIYMASQITYSMKTGRIQTMVFRACINGEY